MSLLNPIYLLLHALNFIVLALILRKLLYKPVKKLMKKRDELVAVQEQKLMQADADISKRRKELEEDIEKSEQKLRSEQTAALADISKKANAILAKSQEEAEQIINEGRANVGRERQSALMNLDIMISELAVEIAGKLIKTQLSKDEQIALVKEGIKEAHLLEK